MWDAESRVPVTLAGHSDRVSDCAYSPDGLRIVSASWDRTLKIWDAESGAELATLSVHSGDLRACAYSPDGRRIVSANTALKVWDAESGAELATLSGHSKLVETCVYSPDGKRIVSASWDKTLKLWDAESGAELATLTGHSDEVRACAYSPDGRRIVSGSTDGALKQWDAESGEELAPLPSGHSSWVKACVYSPDGERIVSASWDHTLKLCHSLRKAEPVCFLALSGVSAAALGNGGYSIFAGDRDGRIYLLRLVNLQLKPPLVTLVHIYHADTRDWDARPTAKCERCGKRFTPQPVVISAIHSINDKANLSLDQSGSKGVFAKLFGCIKNSIYKPPSISPCTALPPEAWDDPHLLSECPHCHQPLRFNPFIIDNRERY
jgi:WD40 repeat protein